MAQFHSSYPGPLPCGPPLSHNQLNSDPPQDVQVYHYYRDLIKFYSKGNPKLMLKCINPKEGELLDFASGIHIRFRLAGVSCLTRVCLLGRKVSDRYKG